MSNALVVGTLSDAIIAAVNAAWVGSSIPSSASLTVGEDSIPRTIQALPFVSVNWKDVPITFGGKNAAMSQTNQEYRYEIILFFAMPPALDAVNSKISRLKAVWASELIEHLQTGATFAGVANLPIVGRVSAEEKSPPFDGCGMVTLWFTCQVQASHH